MIYVIGSLRSARPQEVAKALREAGHEVFDDWQAAGPIADDSWRDYERTRGRSFKEALKGPAARNIFEFDKRYLDAADIAVLVLPAGKSAHLELGYFMPKPTFILLDDPERWDVMYQFATGVTDDVGDLIYMIDQANAENKSPNLRKQCRFVYNGCAHPQFCKERCEARIDVV